MYVVVGLGAFLAGWIAATIRLEVMLSPVVESIEQKVDQL